MTSSRQIHTFKYTILNSFYSKLTRQHSTPRPNIITYLNNRVRVENVWYILVIFIVNLIR